MAKQIPIIAIIGKPNVGKSTFFNKVVGEKRAVVEDFLGVTRDRNYAFVDSYEFPFHLVDTGGIEMDKSVELSGEIVEQVKAAMAEADVILAMFDGNSPVQENDHELMKLLRGSTKPIVYCVNKCDGKEQVGKVAEYYELGVAELHDLSALHGHGVINLLGDVMRAIPDYKALVEAENSRQEEIEKELEFSESQVEPETILNVVEEPEIKKPAPQKMERPEQVLLTGEEEDEEPVFAPVSFSGEDEQGLIKELGRKTAEYEEGKFAVRMPDVDSGPGSEISFKIPENIKVCLVGRPNVGKSTLLNTCLLYTSPSPRDATLSRMPSSA